MLSRALLFASAAPALVASLLATPAAAEETVRFEADEWVVGQPVPAGYHTKKQFRYGLIGGGAALFIATYAGSVFAYVISEANQDGCPGGAANQAIPGCPPVLSDLRYPVGGPFAQVGTAGVTPVGNFVLAVDGLAQAGGLVMVVLGFALPTTVVVRDDMASSTSHPLELTVVPILAHGQNGLGVVGRF
jgi:hypothetical protein